MKTILNPFKIKPNYPSNQSDFKHVKLIEKHCLSNNLNFNKRYLIKQFFSHKLIKSGYNFLLGCEPDEGK